MAASLRRPEASKYPFPAPSKTMTKDIGGISTSVTSMMFADKLLLTVSGPSGKLAHWVHVPLSTASAAELMNINLSRTTDTANELLPRADLTATTVLGGTKREEEVVGQTLATTIASAVLVKRPQEERMLVLGFGLQNLHELRRSGFEEVVGLCLDCL